jgi:hypothetical protein
VTRKRVKGRVAGRRPARSGQVHRPPPLQRAALPGLIVVVEIFFIVVTPSRRLVVGHSSVSRSFPTRQCQVSSMPREGLTGLA